jgi:succinyl-diaminopimelate desuccinylase
MHERLLKAVDDRVDDLVALTADLIRFPTINPPGELIGHAPNTSVRD